MDESYRRFARRWGVSEMISSRSCEQVVFALVLYLFLGVSSAGAEKAEGWLTVTAREGAEVKSEASAFAESLGAFKRGVQMQWFAEREGWYLVDGAGGRGALGIARTGELFVA